MWDEGVAERYAEALYDLASEQGRVAETERDLLLARQALKGHAPLAHALRAPDVPDEVKKSIVKQIFGGLSPVTLNFLFLLVDRQRVDVFEAIVAQFHSMADKARGQVDVDVTVACDLVPSVRESVQARVSAMTGRQAVINWHVDPRIIGGIVVRIKDTLVDYSLGNQLNEMRERLVRAQV